MDAGMSFLLALIMAICEVELDGWTFDGFWVDVSGRATHHSCLDDKGGTLEHWNSFVWFVIESF